jgi:hypothetical protein
MDIDFRLASFDDPASFGDWPVSHVGFKLEISDGRARSWNRFATAPATAEIADDAWGPWHLVTDEALALPS